MRICRLIYPRLQARGSCLYSHFNTWECAMLNSYFAVRNP
nr:MAG TPA: hypothetical protein [Caudoviricetes sp.]